MWSVNMGLSCFSQVENILVLKVLSGVISVIRIKVGKCYCECACYFGNKISSHWVLGWLESAANAMLAVIKLELLLLCRLPKIHS